MAPEPLPPAADVTFISILQSWATLASACFAAGVAKLIDRDTTRRRVADLGLPDRLAATTALVLLAKSQV